MQLRRLLYVIGALLFIGIAVYFIDDAELRCHNEGLTREAALKISDERLQTKTKRNRTDGRFVLQSAQHEEDLSWIFMYRADECTIAIIVDKCGASDIGGISSNCT